MAWTTAVTTSENVRYRSFIELLCEIPSDPQPNRRMLCDVRDEHSLTGCLPVPPPCSFSRLRPLRRAIRSPHGTTVPPNRRSLNSYRRPLTSLARASCPQDERIATFDQDGTLWIEHATYTQVVYCLDRVPAVVKAKPELAKVELFKTVLSGDREAKGGQ